MQNPRWLALIWLSLWSICFAPLALGQIERFVGQAEEMQIQAESMQHDRTSGQVMAKGKVTITYGKMKLTADEVNLNQQTHDFVATGNVEITSEEGVSWRTPSVKGNLSSHALQFGPYRLDAPIWHSGGASGSSDEEEYKILDRAWLSTCELEKPHYCLYARKIIHRQDNTFQARHVFLKFGPVPVLYFPVLWGRTDGSSSITIKPGYGSRKGAYLKLSRNQKIQDLGDSETFLDLMSKRGIGLGNKTKLATDKQELELNLYGVLDSDPPETSPGYNRRFEETHDRYRLHSYYRNQLLDDLTLRLNVDFLSDIDMLEDWFRREYRRRQQPRSYLDLSYDPDGYSLSLTLRPRLNDFYTTVETLPELHLDIPRLALWESPFQYQSRSSIGYYSLKWRKFDLSRAAVLPWSIFDPDFHVDPGDYQSWRGDTQHFLYLPLVWEDRVSLTPRVGMRATYYSKTSKRRVGEEELAYILDADNPDWIENTSPVLNYDTKGGARTRMAFETGAELRSKWFSDWSNTSIDRLQIDGLRHLVEPYVNYTYAHRPSVDREHLLFFDETDRLTKQHFIRFGLDQRWQTRREQQHHTLLRLQSYADLHFDRGEASGRHAGDLGNRLDFIPRRDLRFWGTLVHDMGEGDIQRGEAGMAIGREDQTNFSLRYLYRNAHLSRSVWSMGSSLVDLSGESSYLKKHFESSDIITGRLEVPLNPLTKVIARAEYDFARNRLSEHSYELHRQLHCWVMALGFGWDNSDFQAMIMFHLTAFPKVKLDLNL